MTLSSNGIGVPAYFSSYLSRIREAHPDFPLDPVVFQSILLCLIAGGPHGSHAETASRGSKHLILRTSPEDIGLVLNIASLILTTVFGLPTHKYKAKHDFKILPPSPTSLPPDHPSDFLRKLFFRERQFPRHSVSADRANRDRSRRTGSGHGPKRSSTLPIAASNDSPGHSSSPLPLSMHTRESTLDSQTDTTSIASRIIPTSPASTLRMRPQAPRMQTEPTSLRKYAETQSIPISIGDSRSNSYPMAVHLPRALVVSGLEHVEIPAQRLLLRTLQDRRIVFDNDSLDFSYGPEGTWDLPSDFLLVYVCPLDPHERPPILETLLDRFAMSADINISASVRQEYTAYRSSISTPLSASFNSLSPRIPLSALHPLDSPATSPSPRLRPLPLGSSPQLTPTHPTAAPIISSEELEHLRALTVPVPTPSPNAPCDVDSPPEAYTFIHPSLNLYLSDLFSAARHHPSLDGTLVTLRAHRDAEALVRAYRVLCGDSVGAELVATVAAAPPRADTDSHTDDDDAPHTIDTAHALGWADEPAWLGAELRAGTRKAASVRSVEGGVHVQVRVYDEPGGGGGGGSFAGGGSLPASLPLPPEVWDVSEVDIGRVFPRVVSHRVRVRSGPDDEILGSIMHPAVHQLPAPDGPPADRKTVKQIIVGILADV